MVGFNKLYYQLSEDAAHTSMGFHIYSIEIIWKKHGGKFNPDVNYSCGGVRVWLNLCTQDFSVYRAETFSSNYETGGVNLVIGAPSLTPLHFICLVFREPNRIATFPSVKNWQKTLNEF